MYWCINGGNMKFKVILHSFSHSIPTLYGHTKSTISLLLHSQTFTLLLLTFTFNFLLLHTLPKHWPIFASHSFSVMSTVSSANKIEFSTHFLPSAYILTPTSFLSSFPRSLPSFLLSFLPFFLPSLAPFLSSLAHSSLSLSFSLQTSLLPLLTALFLHLQ